MRAAFSAKKYDSYFNRGVALVQGVARSGDVSDPLLLASVVAGSPLPDFESVNDYAYPTLPSGQTLEAGGKMKAASQQYWRVARFGQIVRLGAETGIDRVIASATPTKAYERLRSLDRRVGNASEANLLGYQLRALARERQDFALRNREDMGWMRTFAWIANCVQLFALALLLAAFLLVIAGCYWLARRWRRVDAQSRLTPMFSWLGIIGAAGLLASSAGLYLSYRPCAEMLNLFVVSRSAGAYFSIDSFSVFFWLPGPVENGLFGGPWRVYFWDAVIFLCGATLLAILARPVIEPMRPKLVG
jgi:hypothetical protein